MNWTRHTQEQYVNALCVEELLQEKYHTLYIIVKYVSVIMFLVKIV